jgi:hypothetical protein
VENGIIIVKLEIMPEAILQAKILLILNIQIFASLMSDFSDIMVVILRARRSPTTMIGSKLGPPHKRSWSIKRNEVMDRMLWTMIR